jgi:CheY-like chemotaxis protein
VVVPARREAATIVLVEDDPAVARAMADALDSSGYRVWHAATGSEARTLVGRSNPDLIVLDLMLPDVDGLVLCSGLKQIAPTPIVICSATPQKRFSDSGWEQMTSSRSHSTSTSSKPRRTQGAPHPSTRELGMSCRTPHPPTAGITFALGLRSP